MFKTVEALHDNITNKGFYPLTHEQAVIGNDEVDLETKLKKINKDISKTVIDYNKEYLTTEALDDGTISFIIISNINTDLLTSISYSVDDGTTWTTIDNEDDKEDNIQIDVNVSEGDKVLWKGNALALSDGQSASSFVSNIQINVYGNIMSLLYGDNFINQTSLPDAGDNFHELFAYNHNGRVYVVDASNLILPATTLAERCYDSMFYNCTSLTNAPALPAITLAQSCYNAMFQHCTSLTKAPELPATTLAVNCYLNMFFGCTSLTTAPTLPATTLATYCYYQMFRSCTSLNYIKCLATDISATNCTQNWVDGVSASGIFIKSDSIASWTTGINGIPSGWNVYTESEWKEVRHYELDATISSKVPKVSNPTTDNFASFNSDGTIKDSGHSHSDYITSIKTINNESLVGTGNIVISGLPQVSATDNGKILMVVNGQWQLVSPSTLYSGSGVPNNANGNNGDIYIQTD